MTAQHDGEVVLLAWSDYVGITRCRGVPSGALKDRMAHGLGWAVAGQALTPFEDIADNPWGPMTEVRQTPLPPPTPASTSGRASSRSTSCSANSMLDGRNWECCTRGFYKAALADLESRDRPHLRRRLRARVPAVGRGHHLDGAVLDGADAQADALSVGPDPRAHRRRDRARDGRAGVWCQSVRDIDRPGDWRCGRRAGDHHARGDPRMRPPPRPAREFHPEADPDPRRKWRARPLQPGRPERHQPDL